MTPRHLPLLAAALLAACQESVRLHSRDGSITLRYACGERFQARVATQAERDVVQRYATYVTERQYGQEDYDYVTFLDAYQAEDAAPLERLVVDYVCTHGDPLRPPVFPEARSEAPDFEAPLLASVD